MKENTTMTKATKNEYRFAAIAHRDADPHAVSGTYIQARSRGAALAAWRKTEAYRFASETGKLVVCELWKS
jgi:hypothetical protein